MSGQRGLLNRPNGWSKQTPPCRRDLSYLTHTMSMSALAQQLRLQDYTGKGQSDRGKARAFNYCAPIPASNRSAINQASKSGAESLLGVEPPRSEARAGGSGIRAQAPSDKQRRSVGLRPGRDSPSQTRERPESD